MPFDRGCGALSPGRGVVFVLLVCVVWMGGLAAVEERSAGATGLRPHHGTAREGMVGLSLEEGSCCPRSVWAFASSIASKLQREGSGKSLPRNFQLIFKFQICQNRRKAGFLYRLDPASPALE